MFARLSRLFSSFFNQFMSSAEDPVLILENNIRELQGLIPQLNKSVATSQAAVIQIQKELAKCQEEVLDLDRKIKAAIQMGEEGYAKDMIIKLQNTQARIAKLEKDLLLAQENLKGVQQVRDLRVREIKTKQEEVRGKINEHRFAQIQGDIAQALDSSVAVNTDSVSSVIEENMAKLDQKTAENQALLQASLQNSRTEIIGQRIEQRAAEMEAESALEEYKAKMGLPNNSGNNQGQKTSSQADKVVIDAE